MRIGRPVAYVQERDAQDSVGRRLTRCGRLRASMGLRTLRNAFGKVTDGWYVAVATAVSLGALVCPAATGAAELDCVMPAVLQLPTVRLVGFRASGVVADDPCLSAGDQLRDLTLSWGDGSSSVGNATYSPGTTTVLTSGQPATVADETVAVTGTHVYTRPGVFDVVAHAIDGSTGQPVALRDGAAFDVLAPDRLTSVRPVSAPHGSYRGRLATLLVELPTPPARVGGHRITAEIAWGDGTDSAARLSYLKPNQVEVLGQHRWHRAGSFTVHVLVTDLVGPQRLLAAAIVQVTGVTAVR